MYDHERSLVEQLNGKPFALIGVNSDDDRETIRQIAQEKNLNWRSFFDGAGGPIARTWRIRGWPTTFLIDEKGVIRHKNLRGVELDRAIEEMLAEMGHEIKLDGEHSGGGLPLNRILIGAIAIGLLVLFTRDWIRQKRSPQ